MNQRVLVLNNGSKPFETMQVRVGVTEHLQMKGLQLNLIVDTGATNTSIARRHADMLGLTAVEHKWMNTASGRELCPVYRCDLYFSDFTLQDVHIVGMPLPSDDMLLGMDILGKSQMQMGKRKDGTYGVVIMFPSTL